MKKSPASFHLSNRLAWTALWGAAGTLAAQTSETASTSNNAASEGTDSAETHLPEVVVTAQSEGLYKPERLQSPKYTEPLREIPQTITVIPKEVIEDRGAFSLREVLRNTPGISMQAGEGGGGLPGDNLTIRGFSARTDWFVDGVRDYGGYNRDPFNVEQVEVTKGPSSSTGGRGTTGGSINLSTKTAHPDRAYQLDLSGGTNELFRGTLDVNEPLNEHSAIRINGLYHTEDTAGRDVVSQERYGIAASMAFGLGTDTRVTVNYQHMTEDNIPDYGIPWIPSNGVFVGAAAFLNAHANQPAPVDYDSFYGRRSTDFEDVNVDVVTGIVEHDFNENLSLRNVMRYGRTYRNSAITAPRFADTDAVTPGNQYTTVLNRQVQAREQTQEVFSNQLNLNANFETGPLKHALVTGLEFAFERQLNANAALNLAAAQTDLFNPNPGDPFTGVPALGPGVESHLDTISIYLFDTIEIGKYFEINGGLRYDHLEADAGGFSRKDDLVSWKTGVVFKPVEYGTLYFGYGTSFNPSIDTNTGLGLAPALAPLGPEENQSFELGTKWDLFKERLSLTAAIFRTEKTNARTNDPILGTVLAGNQVVDGIEFGIAGSITDDWQVFGGYSYMESEIESSAVVAQIGQTLGNTPDHSFNLWTTYNLPRKFQIGFGTQYVGERTNGNGNTPRTAPGYWTCDAMLSCRVTENVTLRLNVYNLANERYIDRVGGGHFVPGPGRSAALTASIKF